MHIMKKISILFAALATMAMGFVSCQKEESATMTFTAHTETDGSKTLINGEGYFEWQNTDVVRFVSPGIYDYSVTPRSSDPTWAELTGPNMGDGPYIAFYPADIISYIEWEMDESVIRVLNLYNEMYVVGLTNTQHTPDGRLSCAPMVALSATTNLQFTNLCSAIRVCMPAGAPAISSIDVEADQPISGGFVVATDAEGKQYCRSDENLLHRNTCTLAIDNPQSYSAEHYYYITLPVGTYHNITLNFHDAEGHVATKSISSNNGMSLRRSQFTTLRVTGELNFE